MSGVGYTPPPSQADIRALADAMPKPATSAPPAVQVDSVAGDNPRYARADHTHESRLLARAPELIFDASGRAPFTFPKAYPVGVKPVVVASAEQPADGSYRVSVDPMAGSVTNEGVILVATRQNKAGVIGVLNSALTLFAPVTGKLVVSIMSRAPS